MAHHTIPPKAVRAWLIIALWILTQRALVLTSLALPAAEFSIVHSFSFRAGQGRHPQAALCAGSDGWLYGVTPVGGNANQGTVFRFHPDRKVFETLHHFTKLIGDGGAPVGALIEIDKLFYGTTEAGGDASIGTIFRLAGDGAGFRLVRSFDAVARIQSPAGLEFDGKAPTTGLIDGHNGLLYGTTDFGGTFDRGTIYAIAPDGGEYFILHSFRGPYAEGAKPQAALLQTKDGYLLGTTSAGGSHNRGTIFRVKSDGSEFETLHNFSGINQDGQNPFAALAQDESGMLFGVTRAGGTPAQGGALFKMKSDGTDYQVPRGFTGLQNEPGGLGNGLALIDDKWFLCTSLVGGQHIKGTVFLVSKDGKELSVLHHFAGPPSDGLVPLSPLIQMGDRAFYGTTERGGSEDGGTIYRVILGKE